MRRKIKTSSHQTYFVFVTLFSKPALTKQKYSIYENSHKKMEEIKMKFDFSVAVGRRLKSGRGTAV